jgi:hypothetical protein
LNFGGNFALVGLDLVVNALDCMILFQKSITLACCRHFYVLKFIVRKFLAFFKKKIFKTHKISSLIFSR